jgi:uncharacterized protein (DUF362 family)/NAD-dependent dihydropyrimidine dehydrogenase PreA subunit
MRVLVKPNLLFRSEPDRAIVTHPEIVRAVIRAARDAGALVTVGDSPGGLVTSASAGQLFLTTGLAGVCQDEGARLVLLDEATARIDVPDRSLFASFTVGKEAVEADLLINLPKLKTHGLMLLTGGVKNLFGLIPGLEKAQYHLKVPERSDFAEMLVDLAQAIRPGLTIMDAVTAMEGEGPSGGRPRHVGALLASSSPFSLDAVAAAMAGYRPGEVYTVAAAAGRGLGPRSADEVPVMGTPWRELAPEGFAHPPMVPKWDVPGWLRRPLKNLTTARPYLVYRERCTRCRACHDGCPAGSISFPDDYPAFDLDSCIRCYCCPELCPVSAIGLRVPLVVRMLLPGSRR